MELKLKLKLIGTSYTKILGSFVFVGYNGLLKLFAFLIFFAEICNGNFFAKNNVGI